MLMRGFVTGTKLDNLELDGSLATLALLRFECGRVGFVTLLGAFAECIGLRTMSLTGLNMSLLEPALLETDEDSIVSGSRLSGVGVGS